jgi:hypothetical protein
MEYAIIKMTALISLLLGCRPLHPRRMAPLHAFLIVGRA